MNIEGLGSYQNAVSCMKTLNQLANVEANIISGGLKVQCFPSMISKIERVAAEFEGCITHGYTEMKERIMFPYKTGK